MIVDSQDVFRLKYFKDHGIKILYLEYLEMVKCNGGKPCGRSVHYLEAFVQHPPMKCLKIIQEENKTHFTLSPWGDEYLLLLCTISAYYLDSGIIEKGLLWALKAIHLFDYFAPSLNKEMRDGLLRKMPATMFVWEFSKQFERFYWYDFYLNWEINQFNNNGMEIHSNDN